MSQQLPNNSQPRDGENLPDYAEEVLQPPAKIPWFKDSRRRKIALRMMLALILLTALVPAYRGLKGWRASSLMKKSGEAFAIGDSQRGVSLLKQAMALAPGSIRIRRAVELYNARSGDGASFGKLLERMRAGDSDDEELLGIAEIGAITNRLDVAREALGLLSRKPNKRDLLRRSLLEASLMARAGNPLEAADLCVRRSGEAPDRKTSGYLRIQAALDLLSVRDAPDGARILDLLRGVIGDRSGASVDAWRILAGLILSPSPGITVPDAATEAGRLSAIVASLSGRKPADDLLAADLAIKANPGSKDAVVARLIKARRIAPRSEQLDLARWLNGRECAKEVIKMAGSDRPANDTDWLLVVLDSKTVLGAWDDIPHMLATPAGSGIQDAVRHLYLARIATMKGDGVTAEEEWRSVGASLHLEKPETLAYIAAYEEQIGAFERAARAYREMADREPTKVTGLVGLIRCQPRDAPAKKLIPLYEELVPALSDNQDAACDLAYLRLLSKEDVPEAATSAERLFQSSPNVLTRISTVALGRLRSGDPKGAMDLYRGKEIDWNTAAPPWRAVRCAVLRANGLTDEADSLQRSIDPKLLRPEERDLLGISQQHGGASETRR